jgi:hypothetical protein
MKGVISPAMRKLLNNRPLYDKFIARLSGPREEFSVSDGEGNTVHYSPYPKKPKLKRKRNLLQLLSGILTFMR